MAYSKFFIRNRPFILAALNFECVICRIRSTSNHVHHRDFNSQNDNLENYVVLCEDCHKIAHKCGIKIGFIHKNDPFASLRDLL